MARRALSATRTADLLNFLAAHPEESLSYSELSRRLQVNLASTHSLLMALTECGYLTRDPRDRYSLLSVAGVFMEFRVDTVLVRSRGYQPHHSRECTGQHQKNAAASRHSLCSSIGFGVPCCSGRIGTTRRP